MGQEVITLGGGCFWCIEAVFEILEGVSSSVSGYAGGHTPNPNYREVCTGTTGHAEVVQVTYDPDVTSTRDVLEVFFAVHDPTTLNRQGPDVGTQYRSAIYYHTAAQKAEAEALIKELDASGTWSAPIVTEVAPIDTFYKAEDYHQEYFRHNGGQPYCRAVVAPKVSKFRQKYASKLKA